jgi:uncharacterized protein
VPEYLAPGVYVEETSFRPKTIEGVSTSTAGFTGPARYGPTSGEPPLITSFLEFERIYGGLENLRFNRGDPQPNFLAHAVRAFFDEGGKRCYVGRIFAGDGGVATAELESGEGSVTARFPGRAGEMRIRFAPVYSDNVLVSDPIDNVNRVRGVRPGDVVRVATAGSPPEVTFYDVVVDGNDLALRDRDDNGVAIGGLAADVDQVQIVTVDVSVERPIDRPQRPEERFDSPDVLQGFSLNPSSNTGLSAYFAEEPRTRSLGMTIPFQIDIGTSPPDEITGTDILHALFGADPVAMTVTLEDGDDGDMPSAEDYRGNQMDAMKSGLAALEDLEDISIVAAPGYSFGYIDDRRRAEAIQAHLIGHAERMRYRIAVLDAPDEADIADIRAFRGRIDSKYAALYYPWVTVLDPFTQRELNLPPSGFVAGIYARNDVEHGVQKAPANEVVRSAIGFEFLLNKAQQEVLNPEGINAFRFFEGRGYRLWGARTVTSDPEWKYVNLRRYFAYLQRSIDKGTQWVVFESNGDTLWANVRRTVEDFLFNEWKSGRLMGLTPDEAYFVKCDRTTMTQNDIDNGRLICLIGVSPLRPAEFVIFRIGQKLLESRG